MRKTSIAIATGLALVAGQALAAAGHPAMARVGDRVAVMGQPATPRIPRRAMPPLPVAIIGSAVILATVYVAVEDSSDSD